MSEREDNRPANVHALSGRPEDASAERESGAEPRRRRGIYLLPNLITTGALFAGFYSIIGSMNGSLEKAAIAIFVAGVLDMLDGRIARLTNTQSAFGVQYDSLSDMVAFGVAPAVLVFQWSLAQLGNLGWVVAFFYMACAALRLARFNTRPDNPSFQGLASPPPAGVMAGMVWLWCDLGYAADPVSIQLSVAIAIVATCLGALMVSNLWYYSPKGINLKGRVPFIYMLAVVVLFTVIFLYPPGVLLAMSVTYGLSGPVYKLVRMRRKRAASRGAKS